MGRKTIQPVPGFKNRRRDGTPSGNAKVIQPVPGFGKRKRPQPIGQNPVMGIVTPPTQRRGKKLNAGFRSKKFPGVM